MLNLPLMNNRLSPLLMPVLSLGAGLLLMACGGTDQHSGTPITSNQRQLSGEQLYVHCRACHGPDGQGVGGVNPPLADSDYLAGDDQALLKIILHGYRSGEWSGVMTGFDSRLSDREIAALVNWLRSKWAPQAGRLVEFEVRALRATTAGRRKPWTPAELRGEMPEY